MRSYTKTDKQIDNYYEYVSITTKKIKTELLFKTFSFIASCFYCICKQ